MANDPIEITVTKRGDRTIPKESPEQYEQRKKISTPVFLALKAAGEAGLSQDQVVRAAGGITDDAIIAIHWLRARGVAIEVKTATSGQGLNFSIGGKS